MVLMLSTNAERVAALRYCRPGETFDDVLRRVANAVAGAERAHGASDDEVVALAAEFYELMASRKFLPGGRTLANAGTAHPVVANCVVLNIGDSMESIFGTLRDAALLQKVGCGTGFPLHLMRPAGTPTRESHGVASGPVSFLHVYDTAFGVIKQQNRHGANMAVMRVDHPDILEFLHCKRVEGRLRNFNVSVGITDAFMQAALGGGDAPWMCEFGGEKMLPRRIERNDNWVATKITPVEMTARALLDEIVECAWSNGEPGVVFLDAVNACNPVPALGRIEASNPCGEQFLHDGDVCNLGALNLEQFVCDGAVDYKGLRAAARLATRFLDLVIDISHYPVERVECTSKDNRRIGLGVMGFADMLILLGIAYGSDACLSTAQLVMGEISGAALDESLGRGARLGAFKNCPAEPTMCGMVPLAPGRRNAALTNVAPTGTISMMLDVSGGIEPYFALAYHYQNVLGGAVELTYVNKHLEAALEKHGCNTPEVREAIAARGTVQGVDGVPDAVKRVFVTAMDIDADAHTRTQIAFQLYTHNAISKTINFPNGATRADVEVAIRDAWSGGCKGCTVYRDGSRFAQVLNVGSTASALPKVTDEAAETPEPRETSPCKRMAAADWEAAAREAAGGGCASGVCGL